MATHDHGGQDEAKVAEAKQCVHEQQEGSRNSLEVKAGLREAWRRLATMTKVVARRHAQGGLPERKKKSDKVGDVLGMSLGSS